MSQILRRLSQIFYRIITRQEPHAILSWRYFLSGQNHMVHLHRRTFVEAWAGYPRVLWCLIAVYSYTLWYLFYSWGQVYSAWTRRSAKLFKEHHLSRHRQALDLLTLALLHSIPPAYYYKCHLYLYPEQQWLDFVYDHELPHWHSMLSPNASVESKHIMSHKQDFSLKMAQLGLPGIATVYEKMLADRLPKELLFNQQSLFIKPNSGSQKSGCYALHYRSEVRGYLLEGCHEEPLYTEEKISLLLDQMTRAKHYLVQPLLENHSLLSDHFKASGLIVIRLVTHILNSAPKTLCAQLGVPIEGQFQSVNSYTIHIGSGALVEVDPRLTVFRKKKVQRLKALTPFDVPQWLEIVGIAEKAHQAFLDIHSIGWDLAITPNGIRLLEGNFNWGVTAHHRQGPLFNVQP